jgi:hypothetical protein
MIIDRCRPLAAVLAGLITAFVLVWLDATLGVERLRDALAGAL